MTAILQGKCISRAGRSYPGLSRSCHGPRWHRSGVSRHHGANGQHSHAPSASQTLLLRVTTDAAPAWSLLLSPCREECATGTSPVANGKPKLNVSWRCALFREDRAVSGPAALPPPLSNITNFQKRSPKIQV